ncbi:MAG: type II secretion system protein GspG [Planctomycetota bacterium]|nr:MAG: type II secretion system protein GspG [Planctomycetota bacterium]
MLDRFWNKKLLFGKKRLLYKGFTLIELMVVIVILGILATVVTLKVTDYLREARITKAKTDINKLVQALELYRMDNNGKYPEELLTLTEATEKRPEGYISGIPKDPWGNDYVYQIDDDGKSYTLLTYGRDGEEGGEGEDADISAKDLSGQRADDENAE